MASPIHWAWTWADSRRWWRTGKPGVLQSMGSRRVRHDLVTEQQQRCCMLFPWLVFLFSDLSERWWNHRILKAVTSTSYWVSVVFSGINVISDLQVLRKTCTVHLFLLKSPSLVQFISAAQSCLTLRSHGLQRPRLPCPLPTPSGCSNSHPLSQWCHLTISSSVVPFSSCLQPFPVRVFSNESPLYIRWPKYWSFSLSPSNECSGLISFRIDWFDLLAVQGTLKSLLQHHSSKASILRCSAFFIVQLSHPYMTTGKTIALTRWTFVSKVMSLLFNMLFMLVIAFLPRSKRLLILWLQSPSSVILEPKKIKSVTVSIVSKESGMT